ncbi:TonB system transport protein ExbD [Amaricoccus solimangrovi]|uniref:Biopolymer transport protein ExbD n=1 Tax=Amaricoccus solimangrovi TaxID=2589815 RepID=A0A501WVM8_9RHOB|nr:TonB system transport protein ExbD [Amaricoccus solimangrovi]TPE49936.1 TonB system transport protein ExbD [Amaricoccus solimangrovi]
MAGGIRRPSGSDEMEVNHEINITPFIDVILVLLIIFMVAAPLATVDVNVDLPASSATRQPRPDAPIYVTLRRDATLALGEETVARAALGPAIDARAGGDRESRIFLRADEAVPYGELMEVMNLLRDAGYLKIALVGLETARSGPASPEVP